MRAITLPLLGFLALAACHAQVDVSDDGNSADGNVHIALNENPAGRNQVSLKVPGFDANITLPGFDMGKHMDLDGIALAPETKVTGMNVDAQDRGDQPDRGEVRVGFTNPSLTPAALVDHYRRSAGDAGYSDIVPTATGLTARHGDKRFALTVSPQGSGSQGTILISGEH